MSEYQVIARRFRPQTFAQILGQGPIVTTLKQAIERNRLAAAYLFCGSRGTGKTTLARVLAKALNCLSLTSDYEPCNQCACCREITLGTSLDVLEIDGASNRGIDEIRRIKETVDYAPASGKYKIYIIDEVHMLTKEAFNALLKTLEEPPPKVKFFFATTEAHKVLSTILSRCQRFNLRRIPLALIVDKLASICQELGIQHELEALQIIAKRAEGGLRDAESLLDQAIAFHQDQLTVSAVNEILGLLPRSILFALDKAGHRGDYAAIFSVTEQLFSEGKDYYHFVEMLIEHMRTLLLIRLGSPLPADLALSTDELAIYQHAARLYQPEQCITILDLLVPAQTEIRFSPTPRFALENLLLKILRTHYRVPVEVLVKRLADLEARTTSIYDPQSASPSTTAAVDFAPKQSLPTPSMSTPISLASTPISSPPTTASATNVLPKKTMPEVKASSDILPQHRYDTLFQFTATVLEGSVQIKKIHRQTP